MVEILKSVLKKRNDLAGPKIVEALKQRHFDAYYISDSIDVAKKVMELIPKNNTVSWGGSMTLDELSIKELLKNNGYTLLDRGMAKTPEERTKIMKQALTCGTFLMSSNAITESGELFNIDATGNRVGALCYGPENVIVIAGMNKIVKNLDEAYSRVRHYAAPVNAQRFGLNTPCSKTGECADCINQETICAQMVATRYCKPAGRIKVIIVGESLGI